MWILYIFLNLYCVHQHLSVFRTQSLLLEKWNWWYLNQLIDLIIDQYYQITYLKFSVKNLLRKILSQLGFEPETYILTSLSSHKDNIHINIVLLANQNPSSDLIGFASLSCLLQLRSYSYLLFVYIRHLKDDVHIIHRLLR